MSKFKFKARMGKEIKKTATETTLYLVIIIIIQKKKKNFYIN